LQTAPALIKAHLNYQGEQFAAVLAKSALKNCK
jgi:hypothetical protein